MSERGAGKRDAKTTVEECWSLDAAKVTRGTFDQQGDWTGCLKWTNQFGEQTLSVQYWIEKSTSGPRLHLHYRPNSDEADTVDETIRLESSRPNFGGVRWWFLCPLAEEIMTAG